MTLEDIMFRLIPVLFGIFLFWFFELELKDDLKYKNRTYTWKHRTLVTVLSVLSGYSIYYITFIRTDF